MIINPNFKYKVLDKSELEANVEDTRVAVMKRVAVTKDKNGQYYLSTVLADKNGKAVYANYFEFEATEGVRAQFESMLGRCCIVKYTTSLYKGRVTLSLDEITEMKYKDALEYEKLYFRSAYPDNSMARCKKVINLALENVKDTTLKNFVLTKCPLSEFDGFADSNIYDGMLGAPLAVVSGMLLAANGLYATQPGWMDVDTYDTLVCAILYCEYIYCKLKPLYAYGDGEWKTDMLERLQQDSTIQLNLDNSATNQRFFRDCKNILWTLAGVDTTVTTVGEIFYQLKKSQETAHRVINITSELPGDSVITIGKRSYTR